ncbi:MAG: hypothetical protein MJY43_05980 [Bacteroidales bacterium]|nr:hypothetical protein [Bacteroidales bacterium]
MERKEFEKVLGAAAAQRDCSVVELKWDDDENVFDVTLDKDGGVTLDDCESVHRAILAAFDRNVEDYSLTVGSLGISSEEADGILAEL